MQFLVTFWVDFRGSKKAPKMTQKLANSRTPGQKGGRRKCATRKPENLHHGKNWAFFCIINKMAISCIATQGIWAKHEIFRPNFVPK